MVINITWQYWTVSEKRRANEARLTSCLPLESDLSRIVVLDLSMGGTRLLVWEVMLEVMVIICRADQIFLFNPLSICKDENIYNKKYEDDEEVYLTGAQLWGQRNNSAEAAQPAWAAQLGHNQALML